MHSYISKITLYVKNQKEALEFWTEKMGFVIKANQEMGPIRWIEVGSENDTTTFVLYEKELMEKQSPDTNTGHPSIILSTDDLDGALSAMVEKGVAASKIMDMPYGKMATFKDQDGNNYVIRED